MSEIKVGAIGFLTIGILFLTKEHYDYHGQGFSETHTRALGILFLVFSAVFWGVIFRKWKKEK
jgi:hypothetical protein